MSLQGEPQQIDRDYVRLLMMMRRFVREEFDVKVAISDAGAQLTLLNYATQSSNTVLQEMGKELQEMLAPAAAVEAQPPAGEHVHYYRGVAQAVTNQVAHSVESATEKAPARQRIYRGRVVAG